MQKLKYTIQRLAVADNVSTTFLAVFMYNLRLYDYYDTQIHVFNIFINI